MASVNTSAERSVTIRRAGPGDIPALVDLRAVMLEAMGHDTGDASAPWRFGAVAWFESQLSDDDFVVVVADHAVHGVVASAVGTCEQHGPSPTNPDGVRGHISNVATLPDHRSRGYARECVSAVIVWFREETTARTVTLNATSDGESLYRSLGFTEPRSTPLEIRLR